MLGPHLTFGLWHFIGPLGAVDLGLYNYCLFSCQVKCVVFTCDGCLHYRPATPCFSGQGSFICEYVYVQEILIFPRISTKPPKIEKTSSTFPYISSINPEKFFPTPLPTEYILIACFTFLWKLKECKHVVCYHFNQQGKPASRATRAAAACSANTDSVV